MRWVASLWVTLTLTDRLTSVILKRTSLAEKKFLQTLHSSEFMESFSYLENCSIFGRKSQLEDLKNDVGLYSEWPDLFICGDTFLIATFILKMTRFFFYLWSGNLFPLTFLQGLLLLGFYSDWPVLKVTNKKVGSLWKKWSFWRKKRFTIKKVGSVWIKTGPDLSLQKG